MLFGHSQQMKVYAFVWCYLMSFTMAGLYQRRLIKHLLTERQHDPLERPVQNDSQTLPVSINLAVQQIIDFMWHDYNLRWKPQDYGNVETIRIPSTLIWIPDVLLYNSVDEKFDSTMKVNAVVQHTGDILYVPPGIFKSICPFDISSFPFDTQNCTLKFGSWTHDYSGINLTVESSKGQLDAYIKNAEWDLEDFSAVNNAIKYDCCPTLYPFVLFTIRIRRRSLYYVTNVVVPCFLISCMTILGFLLAPDSGEKLTLQITILLSVITFSLLISEIMPQSSTAIPIITMYFLSVMCMSTISVTASVFVISLHFRNAKNYTMPFWVQKYVCLYLAWLLRMKRPGYKLTWQSIRHQLSSTIVPSHITNKTDSPECPIESISDDIATINKQSSFFSMNNAERQQTKISTTTTSPVQHTPVDYHAYEIDIIRSELRTVISHLNVVTNYIWRQEKYDNESQDWKFVAMVIDRLCLILFLILMTIFTTMTLLSIPKFDRSQ
ncbi:unnamed protein product [Adineta ricciae]|uniref:Uncharacterized protein n=1 Tax=Adineta ricciae TaxID=249248 RepID=A0A815MWE7_ADIRI|nr:unnamed protein product [Adineta ricciae]